ncbi:MAG TPA: YcaO-like family protein [Longimicrobiaceae bacterium]|nr:YcaO-like family protein [Longimicrobiaceae bacterium]
MLSQPALRSANAEPLADGLVCDPTTGIVSNCFELPIEPTDPRIFCFVAESTNVNRYRTGLVKSSKWGCGVGFTRAWAVGAAVGEAVERYAAAVYDARSLPFCSFDELTEEAVAPERFALYSARQYEEYAGRELGSGFYVPFTRGTVTSWVRGRNQTTGRPILVPAPFVYLPYRYRPGEDYVVDSISSGCACSRSWHDAALKALCEVLERDQIIIAWCNRLSLPRVRFDGDDALGDVFRERFDSPGLRFEMVNATLDLGIPTFVSFVVHEPTGVLVGSATRLDPLEGAVKAMLESAQGIVGWKRELFEGPPERFADDFSDVIDFNQHSKVYMLPGMRKHLEFLWGGGERVALSSIPNRATGDPAGDLRTCVELLAARGLEVITVDLTPEDVREAGLHVVRVVVPEIQVMNSRHDSPLLGGRRLYQVPVTLGLRDRPLAEDELNTFLHPYP